MSNAVCPAAYCRAGWLSVLLCVGSASLGAFQGGKEDVGKSLHIVAGANGSAVDVALLRAAAAELASRSATFRQMLSTVGMRIACWS